MCVCMHLCLCIFLDPDEGEELVKNNVFLARKEQLFANWLFFVRITKRSRNMQHLKS